jgi:hypothetical protein
MAKHRVEFNAHRKVMKPAKVSFNTKAGERVQFVAEKPVEVPVHVEFIAGSKKKK